MELEVAVSKKLSEFSLNVSFSCPGSSLLAVTGPSGAGKTTTVRCIAGLEHPDIGFIVCGDEVWVDTERGIWHAPQKRKVGYVFQEYSLFPHLSVEKNVAFAAESREHVEELLKVFGISHLRTRKPPQISGGERQRTAMAQALAREPNVLLLDEPFSALDVPTKQKLRQELKALKESLSIPIVLITHDLQEAVYLADNIIAMERGREVPKYLEFDELVKSRAQRL